MRVSLHGARGTGRPARESTIDMTFEITIKPSEHAFACAADETVLEAAMKADLLLPYGCRNGACGTCKGRILDGRRRLRPAPAVDAHRRREARRVSRCSAARSR